VIIAVAPSAGSFASLLTSTGLIKTKIAKCFTILIYLFILISGTTPVFLVFVLCGIEQCHCATPWHYNQGG